jgi:hypothetical protein
VSNSTKNIQNTNKTEIRTSAISGKGTFATQKIMFGEYITTLSGELVQSDPNINGLCAKFGISGDDPLQIDDAQFLILDPQSKTINHSCSPNTGLRNKSDLYAVREINANEEITYDYSTTSGTNDTWTMKCGCHSEVCRNVIGNVLTIPASIMAKYLVLDALPMFIRKQLKKAGRLL